MPDNQKSFPSIPVSSWINLRTHFKKSIPGAISNSYLASVLNTTEKSARSNVMPTLRQIGMVDEDGKTNQDLARRFRDDTMYPELCQELLKSCYPSELTDAFPDTDTDRSRIQNWFMKATGVGTAGASRMVAFYITLMEADPSAVKTRASSVQSVQMPKALKASKVPSKVRAAMSAPQDHPQESKPDHSSRKHHLPPLNINLQIHISSDASSDQIRSIFENMSKYIYKDE